MKTKTEYQRLWKKYRKSGAKPADEAHVLQLARANVRSVRVRRSVASWIVGGQSSGHPRAVHVIPLGDHRIRPTTHPHASRWKNPRASVTKSEVMVVDNGRYSSRCRWHKIDYTQLIESWGAVVHGHLIARIYTDDGPVRLHLRPRKGWAWRIDKNGIGLFGPRGLNYHPTASDLLDGVDCRARARELDAQRKKAKTEEQRMRKLASTAEGRGVLVCLRDSMAVGNCRAGTEGWARSHGLDPNRHYAPDDLLAVANGDAYRVSLVIASATRRHLREVDQGFCVVADHRG